MIFWLQLTVRRHFWIHSFERTPSFESSYKGYHRTVPLLLHRQLHRQLPPLPEQWRLTRVSRLRTALGSFWNDEAIGLNSHRHLQLTPREKLERIPPADRPVP